MQDRHFVSCILDGQTPRSDGRSGLAVVSALECAQLSMQQGRTVLIEEVTSEHPMADLAAATTIDLTGISFPGSHLAKAAFAGVTPRSSER